jgi:Glycosyltransferase
MNGLPWGGSEQLWSDAALRLREHGHEVVASVFRWPSRPPRLDDLSRAGVQLAFRSLRPNLRDRVALKLAKRIHRFRDFSHAAWLKRHAPDLLVVSQGGPWDGVPWMSLCRRLQIPYCAIVQANSELWWPADAHLPAIRTALQEAQRLFFVSEANRRLMELQCGTALRNASVVANPCKVDRASAVEWPASDDPLRLACVGRLAPNAKGQDVVFTVLAQEKWRKRRIELHVYGSGPSENSVRSLALFLRLPNVFFHGQVSDIRALWSENHALVLPSRFEGLPLTIVEAMLCGRPVITTDVAGNTELVSDNVNGFVAGAATVPLLDDALERAWSRRAAWRDIGLRARTAALRSTPLDPVGDFERILVALATRLRVPPVAAPIPSLRPEAPLALHPRDFSNQ